MQVQSVQICQDFDLIVSNDFKYLSLKSLFLFLQYLD